MDSQFSFIPLLVLLSCNLTFLLQGRVAWNLAGLVSHLQPEPPLPHPYSGYAHPAHSVGYAPNLHHLPPEVSSAGSSYNFAAAMGVTAPPGTQPFFHVFILSWIYLSFIHPVIHSFLFYLIYIHLFIDKFIFLFLYSSFYSHIHPLIHIISPSFINF